MINYEFREQILVAMHDFIMALGDEDEMETWFQNVISEDKTQEEVQAIAHNNEDFVLACALFKKIVKRGL